MQLDPNFAFRPLSNNQTHLRSLAAAADDDGLTTLGPLQDLLGTWKGNGLNLIWRPASTGQGHFLEINLTVDSLEFDNIPGQIPNRGLQQDVLMCGLRYLQQVSDANVLVGGKNAGLHMETGMWVFVPATTEPQVPASVARLASIPHGTGILAQGIAETLDGPPTINPISITPFRIDPPFELQKIGEEDLSRSSAARTSESDIPSVTQAMIDDPNSLLRSAITGQEILSTTKLFVTTEPDEPVPGGGTANTAFLGQNPNPNPNAVAVKVESTFWIETVKGTPNSLQLQYSQVVMLNFNGLSWPHVSVGTLTLQPSHGNTPPDLNGPASTL